MLQNKDVREFYDRLTLLKSRAQTAFESRYKNADLMILPLKDCALEAFTQGLPNGIPAKIEVRNTLTLDKALGCVIDYKARHQTDSLFF